MESAASGRSNAVQWVIALGSWTVFALVAIGLLIPAVISLTITRVGAPLSLTAAAAAAVGGSPSIDVALLVAPAIVAVTSIFTAEFGRWMVQASAYGDEDRLPLRSPVPAGAAAAFSAL